MTRGGTLLLASVAGMAIANNYAVQPALSAVAADLGVPRSVIGLVPTAALAGCMTGFALLLPLGDHLAPNRLVTAQLTALAAALALAAAAPGAIVLLAAYLLVGAAASVAAQAGSIAGRHAPPGRRGTGVATVAAGMSVGILLSRLAGGTLTAVLGWRRMLLVFAALALVGAIAAATLLPRQRPHARRGYRATLAALPPLLRRFPQLRRAVATGGLWYLAFNLIWVALTLALAQPPHSLGPTAIGLYGLAGVLGLAALPLTGRLTDRYGPLAVITAGMVAAAAGTALLATGLTPRRRRFSGSPCSTPAVSSPRPPTRAGSSPSTRSGPAASAASTWWRTSRSAPSAPPSPRRCSTLSAGGAPLSSPSPRCSSPPPSDSPASAGPGTVPPRSGKCRRGPLTSGQCALPTSAASPSMRRPTVTSTWSVPRPSPVRWRRARPRCTRVTCARSRPWPVVSGCWTT